ncbi:MAG: NAAT family transporter [Planctomycetota bacterium]
MDFLFFVKAFTALFIVVDPLGCIPIFITMTSKLSPKQRAKTALKAVVASLIILTVFSLTGRSIFTFFGTSMGAFQVAGGILLFMIAMNMMRVERSGLSQTVKEEVEESMASDDISLVPLAIPLLAGPSAIATIIVLVEQSSTNNGKLVSYYIILGALVSVLLITYVLLRLSVVVNHLLGTKGLFLAMRLMGLILAAVSVQFIVDGIVKLLPILKQLPNA